MSEVRQVARAIPDYQTNRGKEFRNISVEDRLPMARRLVIARSQAHATNSDFSDPQFRRHMIDTKNQYYYEAGVLGISRYEVETIWRNIVYGDIEPYRWNTII